MWIMIHTPKTNFLNKRIIKFLNQMNFSGILDTIEPDIAYASTCGLFIPIVFYLIFRCSFDTHIIQI